MGRGKKMPNQAVFASLGGGVMLAAAQFPSAKPAVPGSNRVAGSAFLLLMGGGP